MKPRRWTDEALTRAVACSQSYAEVARRLGLSSRGNTSTGVKVHVTRLRLDVSHFDSLRPNATQAVKGTRGFVQVPLDQVFCTHSRIIGTSLRRIVLRERILPYICQGCGLSSWQDQPLDLQLDHINGERQDNRKENLRFLCPNCHSQTSTYGNKRREVA